MLLEVAAETQVAPVKHVGIDVAPNLAQVGHEADLAVEIGHRRNRQINADAWRARHFWKGRDADGGGHLETISGRRVFPQHTASGNGFKVSTRSEEHTSEL